jgi:hypothetical protein
MAVLRTVIKHRLENLKTKHIAFLAFLVLTTLLIVYSVMLLLQDISVMGKSLEQPRPSYIYKVSTLSKTQAEVLRNNVLNKDKIERYHGTGYKNLSCKE